MSFPTLDQSLPWTKVNESNSWKWAFQHLISPCPEPRKRIELLKTSFPTFDQSLPWTKKTNRTLENELSNARSVVALNKKTNRTLENELSNARSVVALNQENELNSWKWAFQRSISRCPEPRKRIELLKMSFPTLDQSLPWTKKTNRTLENELSNIRSVVALNQENESNSWKRAFQHSISPCPEPSKRIELLKTSFPTFDQSLLWTEKTNRTLENELSNIRSVVALNQENESNSWKWAFQHSISRCLEVVALNQENESNSWKWAFQRSISTCPEPRKRIELLKMSFPTFDQSLPWTKKTNRTLENELSNARSVVALNQENESNFWKWAFQHSISRCPEPRKRIELLKTSFPTFDQSLPWTKKTNRTLENELSNIRSVVALNQENESNSWKWAFQHSISRCPEPRKRIELLKMSFPTFDQSLPLTKKTNRTLENELSNTRSVVALKSLPWTKKTNRTLENELSNARSVLALNQENESNSWKWAFQHSISPCSEPRKRIELLKTSFPTFDQSLLWTKKTNRTLENELSNIRSVVALNQENESNSWKWAFQHSISRCPEPSNVGKLIFKSSIRFLGSGQRLIECWKARFQEFDSFFWFRARTDRVLESSFSRVRFVFLVQGNDWSSVGKLIFKSSIRFLGSGQRLKKTNRTLENELSNTRSVLALNQKNESNSWKRAFQHSISRCPEPRKRIELLKMSFPTLDQSLPWTKKTNRTLENELSNIRSVVALNQENESNSWKWAFQRSISRCPEPRKRIELLKMSFPTFDQSLPWTKKTNRTVENELSNIRSVVALNQENESNSWKRAFQHSISRCSEPRKRIELLKTSFPTFDQSLLWTKKRIELLKMSFPTFDQSLPWTKKTNRTLENELSNIRSVVALNQVNESNSWKWAFQHSISRCPEPRKRIELLKTSFPTFDQSLPWTKKTNRTLENELSNIRSVVALNQENESNSWKRAFQHSISRCFEVVALNQENESNSWKWAFQRSISPCPEPRKRIELLKMSFPTFDQSLPWTKKTNRTLENELSNARSVVALNHRALESSIFKSSIRFLGSNKGNDWSSVTTDQMLESSFSRVRFVFLVQGNDWSSVGKLIFKSSIRLLGSGQRLIECWKAHFQEFDSFSWFRATTEVNESNFWKWAFQHSISRCPEPRKRIELLKMSFPTFDQSLPWTKKTNRTLENELSNIRSVLALNQENESNSWKRAFQHSISRCPEPRKRIELLKMSFPTLDQSVLWSRCPEPRKRIELLKMSFQRSISPCPEPRKRIELLKMSFPTLDQSLPWTKKTNRTLENELSNARSVVALNQENKSNSWKWAFQHSISRCPEQENESNSWKRAFQHSISRCPEPRKRIELLKMSFPTLDQSLPWTKKTNRTLENELSNIRSVVALNQVNESNSWKRAFQHSISRCPEPSKWIELLKMSFPTFDQSLPWTKKTNRTLENELSNARSVVALNQVNESNTWKRAFQHSISPCPEPRKRIELLKTSFPTFDQSLPWTKKRIELLKMSFPTLDQSLPWTKKTNRTLENELSNARSVVALNQENESNSWKWAFQHSISRCLEVVALNQENESNSWKWAFQRSISLCPEPRKRIELLKMSFPTFDQSVALNQENELNSWKWAFQRSISRCPEPRNESNSWKWAFQHSISRCPEPSSVTTDQMLESSFSRVRFVYLVQGNDWSSVGKLVFKSSIRLLGSGQRLIECWKAHFQEFDSFSWFRATTEVNESNSWKRAFQHSISRCPEPSSVGKLIFKSSIRFLGSGQGLIERWKAHFQEFDSFSWFRATTSRQRLIERWKARFQEFDSFSWFRATTDRALESSFSRVRFVFLGSGNDWSNVGKLIFKSSICFLGSGQGPIECWKARFQEFDSFSWFRATTEEKRIELLKMSFPTLDQSLPWTKKTNRTLENELSNIRSVLALNQENKSNSWKWAFQHSISRCLNQENESNSWKWAFQRSISRCPEPRKRIELLKMSFPTFDQSLPWTKKTNRTLENELSNIRSVVALNQVNESNSWKWVFQRSISRCPEPRKRIELLKMSFPTLDQSLPWTK